MNSLVTTIAWVLFLSPQTPPQTPSVLERQLLFERRAVTSVRQILAFELDAELPSLSFADWFEKVVGPGAGVRWQLAECADERTEVPNDIRACVETSAVLLDGRLVILRVSVGTFKKGRVGTPTFCFGAISQNGELYTVRRLRDLPNMLRAPGILANRPAANNHSVIRLPGLNIPRVTLAAPNAYIAVALAWNEEEISLPLTLEEPSPPEPPLPPDNMAPSKSPSAAKNQSAAQRLIQGAAIHKAQPVYPPNAKKFNVSGQVEVRVNISAEGHVKEAVATSGHPLLRDAAAAAARKWIFRPTMANGVPVGTQLVLTFDFSVPR